MALKGTFLMFLADCCRLILMIPKKYNLEKILLRNRDSYILYFIFYIRVGHKNADTLFEAENFRRGSFLF